MKLFGKLWKIHSAMLVSLALVFSGCGGGGGSSGTTAGNTNGGSSGGSIPGSTIPGSTNSGNNGGNNGGNSNSVVDNTNNNNNPLPTTGDVEIFIDTNNAIDDLSLLDANGVPTFGKKSRNKAYKGKAKDIDKMWAIQYTEGGTIEKVFPMTKSGSRYIFSSDLSDSRGYKFAFFAYENNLWTGDPEEVYTGPSSVTTTIGTSGGNHAFNGSDGTTSFVRTSATSAAKASLTGVAGGITVRAITPGKAANDIKVKMQEGDRATYFVGTINNGNGGAMVQYRTVAGTKGNVSIRFQYHSDFSQYTTGLGGTNTAPTGITLTASQLNDYASNIYPRDIAANSAAARDKTHFSTVNEDWLIEEYASYDTSSNTITVHYGPSTSAHTIALLLQTQSFAIDTADVVLTGATSTTLAYSDAQTLVTNNDNAVRTRLNVLSLNEANMNSNNGDLNPSGNTDAEAVNITYVDGTSTILVKYQTTESEYNGANAVYSTVLTGNRPTSQATGNIINSINDIVKAYGDASSAVRSRVEFVSTGSILANATVTNTTATNLSGGQDASGNGAVSSFDKNTNPKFNWRDALSLFNEDSSFSSYVYGLRSGANIAPKNRVAFNNLYKNFSYFGILHLEPEDIANGKKSKSISVEAKIVSAQAYRVEGNIGPSVYLIENDTFTLGVETGEIILYIRNYFQQDVSVDDLRITASIKDKNLDADSGRVSVALPVPTTSWVFTAGTGYVGPGTTVVSDTGTTLTPNATTLAAPYRDGSNNIVTDVFIGGTDAPHSTTRTPLMPSGDSTKQDFTITKKSRTQFVRNFQWEDAIISNGGADVTVSSQAAQTDTIIYDRDSTTATSRGRDFRDSFVTRSGTNNIFNPNTNGEFLDLIYHLYYRPRSSVGTDIVNVFIEDGTQDPTGDLQGPRDSALATLAQRVAATRSPTVGLDGSIIPFSGTNKDMIFNTLSLAIPVETTVEDIDSVLEEPDALVAFAIAFDSATAHSDNDPSTMTVSATLTNTRAGETYTYRWNWSHYFELDGDNPLIGMPAGAVIHGEGKHEVRFSDATGLHPDFTSVRVTIRPSAGLDPEGTLRPFDPSTFNPNQSPSLVENIDRDYVFLENYDSNSNALDMSAVGMKAAVKLDIATDPTEAHLIITPKTNSAGEILASGAEIAEAVNYYLANATVMNNLRAQDSNFALLEVFGKGSQLDDVPFFYNVAAGEENGEVLSNARTADDNAGSSLDLNFANSSEYEKVREADAPQLSVHILDTVPSHNGSIFIVDLSNAYPPVVADPGGTINDISYEFVSLATDGVTANPTNQEFFLSVANDTDADGAVTFLMRVKRDNGGTNDSYLMQHRTTLVDGVAIGAPTTRENQFVAYWEVRRVSNQATNLLMPAGSDNTNSWVVADAVDFVGSGADGDLDGTDVVNTIPEPARIFNLALSKNGGEHGAILANDPDDPSNDDLDHMLFSCRLILPTAAAARDSYYVNFRFRPGTPLATSGTNPTPAILTRSYIITVTE